MCSSSDVIDTKKMLLQKISELGYLALESCRWQHSAARVMRQL